MTRWYARKFPGVERVLAVYYAIELFGVSSGGAASHDEQQPKGPPALLAFVCDVGAAMDACLSPRTIEVIQKRYYHLAMAAEHSARGRTLALRAKRATVKDPTHGIARLGSIREMWDAEAHRREKERLERRKDYCTGMKALDLELEARDLVARAVIGKWAGIRTPDGSIDIV